MSGRQRRRLGKKRHQHVIDDLTSQVSLLHCRIELLIDIINSISSTSTSSTGADNSQDLSQYGHLRVDSYSQDLLQCGHLPAASQTSAVLFDTQDLLQYGHLQLDSYPQDFKQCGHLPTSSHSSTVLFDTLRLDIDSQASLSFAPLPPAGQATPALFDSH
eukprot:12273882-Karenia_brevis.AAC.1